MVEVGTCGIGDQDRPGLVVDESPQQRLAIGESLQQDGQGLGFQAERVERWKVRAINPDICPSRQDPGLLRCQDGFAVDYLDQRGRLQLRQVGRQEA